MQTARPAYRLATRTRAVAIPILRDPLTVADEISAEVHRVPAVIRRRSLSEVRDHHLATIRASLIGMGLHPEQAGRLCDEAEQMAEGNAR